MQSPLRRTAAWLQREPRAPPARVTPHNDYVNVVAHSRGISTQHQKGHAMKAHVSRQPNGEDNASRQRIQAFTDTG